MRFLKTNKQLLVQQSNRAFIIDFGRKADKFGKYPHTTLATGKTSRELAISPKASKKGQYAVDNIAFVDIFHVYLTSGSNVRDGEAVWSKPANATKGLIRLSLDGGHDINWTPDGKKLLWFLGAYQLFDL